MPKVLYLARDLMVALDVFARHAHIFCPRNSAYSDFPSALLNDYWYFSEIKMGGPVDHDTDLTVPPPSKEDILKALLHGSFPPLQVSRADINEVRLTGTLTVMDEIPSAPSESAPKNNSNSTKRRFEYAEHVLLGNMVLLPWHDGTKKLAKDVPFKLNNGLQVTYGQICALGGDFFGSKEPICMGKDAKEQIARFNAGFAALAIKPSARALAIDFIKSKREEVAANEAAAKPGSTVSTAAYYESFTAKYIAKVKNVLRGVFSDQEKGYLGLSLINLDHFGANTRTAYNAGHSAALSKAASNRTSKTLEDAYAMNAFADHFLQDSFAAGHLRVPRRELYAGKAGRYSKDICAHVSTHLPQLSFSAPLPSRKMMVCTARTTTPACVSRTRSARPGLPMATRLSSAPKTAPTSPCAARPLPCPPPRYLRPGIKERSRPHCRRRRRLALGESHRRSGPPWTLSTTRPCLTRRAARAPSCWIRLARRTSRAAASCGPIRGRRLSC